MPFLLDLLNFFLKHKSATSKLTLIGDVKYKNTEYLLNDYIQEVLYVNWY